MNIVASKSYYFRLLSLPVENEREFVLSGNFIFYKNVFAAQNVYQMETVNMQLNKESNNQVSGASSL